MKVYQVNVTVDNLMEYDDKYSYEYSPHIYSTREKALKYIHEFAPLLVKHEKTQSVIENPEHVVREYGEKVDLEKMVNAERILYIHSEDTWDRELIVLSISEMEVE